MATIATTALIDNDAPAMDRSWRTVAASTLGLMFSQGTLLLYTFGVFVGPLSAEFGWSRTQVTLALAISQWSFAASAPVWGALIDRVGPRPVLLSSVVALSALVASFGLLTPGLLHFYAVFLLCSFLGGGASPLCYSAVLVRRFDRRLGLALGLALMGVGLGETVLPPLAQALVGKLGWREAYVVLGGLTLVLTFPAALVATRGIGRPVPRAARERAASLMPYVKTRAFVLLCAIFVLLGTVSVGALASLVPIMVGRGFAPAAAAQVAALTGLAAIVGRGGIGAGLDRFHAPHVVAVVALLGLCAFLLLAFATGPVPSYGAALLLGLVVGAEVDFTAFFVRRYFGQVVFGRLYGLAFAIFIVGTGVGPLLMSVSFDRFGGYAPGLLLFSGASVLIVLLTLALPGYANERAAAGPA